MSRKSTSRRCVSLVCRQASAGVAEEDVSSVFCINMQLKCMNIHPARMSTSRECLWNPTKNILPWIRGFWAVSLIGCQSVSWRVSPSDGLSSVLRNGLFRPAIKPISSDDYASFVLRYGAYRKLKKPISQSRWEDVDVKAYCYSYFIRKHPVSDFYFAKKYCQDFLLSEMNEYADPVRLSMSRYICSGMIIWLLLVAAGTEMAGRWGRECRIVKIS